MSNDINTNQHYITESFVKKRFGANGFVERYDVKHDSWKPKASPQFIFSWRGYTQLLITGQPVENSLEKTFGQVESKLQYILPALDDGATRPETRISEQDYVHLCYYCAFLWYLSPFGKAKALAEWVTELEWRLKQGDASLLKGLISDNDIEEVKRLHANGFKFILQGENFLQMAFRHQFNRKWQNKAMMFRGFTKWTVYKSPIELPLSDIALIDYPEQGGEASLYIWPISPNLVLVGRIITKGTVESSKDTIIYGSTLSNQSAEDILDLICASAVKTVVCRNRMDIKAFRERASKKNYAFTKITNLDEVLEAGLKEFDFAKGFRLMPVTIEEYVKYVHSYIRPPNLKPSEPNITHKRVSPHY